MAQKLPKAADLKPMNIGHVERVNVEGFSNNASICNHETRLRKLTKRHGEYLAYTFKKYFL